MKKASITHLCGFTYLMVFKADRWNVLFVKDGRVKARGDVERPILASCLTPILSLGNVFLRFRLPGLQAIFIGSYS